MCGIAGLHLRDESLHPQLGSLLQGMLCQAAERGTDAAGVGIYGDVRLTPEGRSTVAVIDSGVPADQASRLVGAVPGVGPVDAVAAGQTTLVSAPVTPRELESAVRSALPHAVVTSRGESLAVLKGTGHPDDLARTFRLGQARGYQGVAHTRMATEAAVTTT